MNKCALCKNKEANKKNTHYLTDGIIRSCLNDEGSNKREKGAYFSIFSNSPFVDFNFQRSTPFGSIEDILQRPPNELEIESAKKNPFSVDNIFCSSCEDKFGVIETLFLKKHLLNLRSFRTTDFLPSYEIRLFFLLQIWRTEVCEGKFGIDGKYLEEIRTAIFNYPTKSNELLKFPLIVTHMKTEGEPINYTSNIVGTVSGNNPAIILMNDFVIQFYNDKEEIECIDFFGLNDCSSYSDFVNLNENGFIFQIKSNTERLDFLNKLMLEKKVKPVIEVYKSFFCCLWEFIFEETPNDILVGEFVEFIGKKGSNNFLNFSKEKVIEKISDFICKNKSDKITWERINLRLKQFDFKI